MTVSRILILRLVFIGLVLIGLYLLLSGTSGSIGILVSLLGFIGSYGLNAFVRMRRRYKIDRIIDAEYGRIRKP